ncbi:TPA: ORF6C domain-containing protein [Bacillus cereus]|uniref:Phage regulatory protein n=1 Tax=Bacillus thuringiensis serovar subtoxicus TaxID=475791 RepID=A0A9X6FPD9_BACTU|nr:Rha family transcriptional regulator [Bacillus thuringiensis]MEB4840746.1 ORF6C domain-containing protein [Paenibacillus jamilae]MEB8583880.1 ORF6C domain-containing protein [Bacillus cereus]MCR6856723.1 ORF6C domain-containing protein [Bacillus thuringiensis]MDR4282059.1 phage regulatory protein [Bacillus thuringiensis]MEB8595330.1 ORF6C domain-containing protein [Bacillus cereus]
MDQLTVVNKQPLHNELVFEENGEVVTDSLTIAEIFNKDHNNVLKDIRTQIDYAGEEFSRVNFYQSNYTNERGRKYPKYNLTEEAFTLVVFGYNTKEAVQTKIRFIQEFKRMKEYIKKQQQVPTDPMSILKLTFEALEGQKQELQHIKSDVKDLRENAPLFAVECDEISNAVKRHGVALLGGKQSNAYQHAGIRGKVYRDIYNQLYREFGVTSHKAIKRGHLALATKIVGAYTLPIVLSEKINIVNSQIKFSEM